MKAEIWVLGSKGFAGVNSMDYFQGGSWSWTACTLARSFAR